MIYISSLFNISYGYFTILGLISFLIWFSSFYLTFEIFLDIGKKNSFVPLFHLNLIFFLAGVAPVIGLLGTISGVMDIFHGIAASGNLSSSIMASGIGKALITTQAGLMIAIPGIAIGNYFENKLTAGGHSMAFKKEKKDIVNNLNITPLLDMVFILLIFFVVTSSFVQKRVMDIDLPVAATGKELKDKDYHLISLTSQGEIYFDEKKTDLEDLKTFLDKGKIKKVMIAADEDLSSGMLVNTMDFLRKNNIYDIGVFVRKP